MSFRIFVAALPILACAVGASAQGRSSPPRRPEVVPANAQQVLSSIHAINRVEIEAGRLARTKGTDARVRRYGLLLERDHRQADARVIGIAKSDHLPLQALEPSPGDRKMLQELRRASGRDFDRAFLQGMKEGHDEAIALLDTARAQSRDSKVTGLIDQLLPILRQHGELSGYLKG